MSIDKSLVLNSRSYCSFSI